MRSLHAAALGLAALAASAVGVTRLVACKTTPPPPPPKPPNVLIVLWDTVRADHLTPYGYTARPTTPWLDAFAKEATLYERAVSRGMWTLPSHAAIFTGLTETSHGAWARTSWLDNRHQTLAERLGGAGYDTFAFSTNVIVNTEGNVVQGFQTFETSYPRPEARRGRYLKAARQHTRNKIVATDASNEIGPAFAGSNAERWERSVFKDAAPVAHQALSDFLVERPGAAQNAPWFGYLNLMEAHSPRIPSMASRKKVIADDALIELGLATDASVTGLMEYVLGKRELTPDQIRAIEAVYDASLRDLDDATGALVEDLRSRGILDDTVVIVVADHGEMLGEHRMYEHRYAMWDPLLHVPLIIRYPKSFPQGARVAQRMTTADLFSTIVELAGLPKVEGVESTSLVGRTAFEPVVVSQMLDPFSFRMASLLETYPDVAPDPFVRTYCVGYQQDWKLIYASDDQHGLFDLARDPHELANLYASETGKVKELEDGLLAFENRLVPYDPALRDAEDQRMVGRHERILAGKGGLEPEEAQALAALGYLGSDLKIEQVYPEFCGPRGRKAAP
jgi:arylsulfatase A-like enzyme